MGQIHIPRHSQWSAQNTVCPGVHIVDLLLIRVRSLGLWGFFEVSGGTVCWPKESAPGELLGPWGNKMSKQECWLKGAMQTHLLPHQ